MNSMSLCEREREKKIGQKKRFRLPKPIYIKIQDTKVDIYKPMF